MLKLRPHHSLCIQKFTGHGYDEAFTAHMTDIVRLLDADPETRISVICGCDELCSRCPNNDGGCVSLQKVAAMDNQVLDICGYHPGDIVTWREFSHTAREKILLTDRFLSVCSNCQWFSLCKNTEMRSLK